MTDTPTLDAGDRVRVNTPDRPHHGREGSVTSLGPFAHSVTLDGDHGAIRMFSHEDLVQLSEPGYDGVRDSIDKAEAWMDAWADHCDGKRDEPAGDPPMAALAVVIWQLRDALRAFGNPDEGERLAGWGVYESAEATQPKWSLDPQIVFRPVFEPAEDADDADDER